MEPDRQYWRVVSRASAGAYLFFFASFVGASYPYNFAWGPTSGGVLGEMGALLVLGVFSLVEIFKILIFSGIAFIVEYFTGISRFRVPTIFSILIWVLVAISGLFYGFYFHHNPTDGTQFI